MEERSLKIRFAKQNTILRFDSSRSIFYLDWNDIFGIMLCIATIIRIIFPGKNQTGLKRSLFLIGEHIEFESSTSPKKIALSLPLLHCGERARMVGGDALLQAVPLVKVARVYRLVDTRFLASNIIVRDPERISDRGERIARSRGRGE